MVEVIASSSGKIDFGGVVGDIKPTTFNGVPLAPGSSFYEADSKNAWIFINNTWWPA